MSTPEKDGRPVDRLTVIAVALIAYAITNVSHEGLGHGGACVLVGGKPLELNAVYFDCDKSDLAASSAKWISAGGTLVNLVTGALAWLALRRGQGATVGRWFTWLLMTLSLLQATGYWLFSGLGNIGDWAKVVEGLAPAWPWRVALAVAGGAGYWLTIRLALRALGPFLGDGDDRVARARTLMLLPYLAGGALYLAAGALNPQSPVLVLISAAAASLGGTSALCWSFNMLRDRKAFPPHGSPPLSIRRSPLLLAAGAATAAIFILVLGRSVKL
jgi:hypothetical protein